RGGGGGGSLMGTVKVREAVRPSVSFASSVTLWVPATGKRCWATFSRDQAVSQVPSDSQSQRTWIPLSGSWSSKTIAVKLTRVSVSAGKGDQVKFTYGGALGGGGGASYVRFTSADG